MPKKTNINQAIESVKSLLELGGVEIEHDDIDEGVKAVGFKSGYKYTIKIERMIELRDRNARRKKVAQLRESGKLIREISHMTGYSESHICNLIKEYIKLKKIADEIASNKGQIPLFDDEGNPIEYEEI